MSTNVKSRAKKLAMAILFFQLASPVAFSQSNAWEKAANAEHKQTDNATALALAELERMALENNPTLAQADAAIRVAEGKRKQAGLFPNPIIGYQGEELSTRAFSEKSEHFFFVEQMILTGGKLKKSRRIFEHEQTEVAAEKEAQRQRVLNSVRLI